MATMSTTVTTTLKETGEGAGIITSVAFDETGDMVVSLTPSIPGATNDVEVAVVFTMAQLICISINSDKDVTLETNSSSAADNTYAIKAGKTFYWGKNTGIANPFTANVTKFFFSNAGAGAATVRIRILRDGTP